MKTNKKHTLLLGGHMSISGGMYKAILRGEEINCTAIQLFTKSNRQWSGKELTGEDIKLFKDTWKKSSCVKSITAHSTYLINIGSSKKDVYEKSLTSLVDELGRCESLGIPYLVLHPGSHLGVGEEKCLKQVAKGLDNVLQEHSGKTNILIETMAGQGTGVCYKFEHIATIFDHMKNKKKVGVCFDTCHVFASGYDFRTKTGYKDVMKAFDDIIGLNEIKVMHINDSMRDFGTRVDRHEDIGKGKIGPDAFGFLFNDERFFDIPKILETPEGTLENYAMNMKFIKKLLTQKTKKTLEVLF